MPYARRVVLGRLILVARIAGVLLIALAILDCPAARFLTGHYAGLFELLGSLALLIVGTAWLFGVALLIRFFDDALSRN